VDEGSDVNDEEADEEGGVPKVGIAFLLFLFAGKENMPGLMLDSVDRKVRTRSGEVLIIMVVK
jgi:hypothetical protein